MHAAPCNNQYLFVKRNENLNDTISLLIFFILAERDGLPAPQFREARLPPPPPTPRTGLPPPPSPIKGSWILICEMQSYKKCDTCVKNVNPFFYCKKRGVNFGYTCRYIS